jgi:hypothetical protein
MKPRVHTGSNSPGDMVVMPDLGRRIRLKNSSGPFVQAPARGIGFLVCRATISIRIRSNGSHLISNMVQRESRRGCATCLAPFQSDDGADHPGALMIATRVIALRGPPGRIVADRVLQRESAAFHFPRDRGHVGFSAIPVPVDRSAGGRRRWRRDPDGGVSDVKGQAGPRPICFGSVARVSFDSIVAKIRSLSAPISRRSSSTALQALRRFHR